MYAPYTQIYLTEDQDDQLKRLAAERHESKASLIRAILDRELGGGDGIDEDRAVLEASAGICADYPDWPEWLDRVRGGSAAERLTERLVSTLFDSTVLIAHLRGDERATELLVELPREERLVSVISRTEIEGGMRSAERADVARLFGVVTLVPVTDAIAQRAGEYLRTYRRSHQGIDIADYLIAASVDVRSADLSTLNVKHFPMFEGLAPAFG